MSFINDREVSAMTFTIQPIICRHVSAIISGCFVLWDLHDTADITASTLSSSFNLNRYLGVNITNNKQNAKSVLQDSRFSPV